MKRLVLPTVFFYLCTFAALSPVRVFASALPALSIIAETQIGETMVQELAVDRILKMVDPPKPSATPPFTVPTSATTALSGLVAGSSAMAGIAFYARTGRDPVYAAASAVASAADALFVPAYQAFKANFVSPETFPASAAQYVGLESSVGAKVGDIVDHVNDSDQLSFPSLKSAIGSASSSSYDLANPIVINDIFNVPGYGLRKVIGSDEQTMQTTTWDYYRSTFTRVNDVFYFSPNGYLYAFKSISGYNTILYRWQTSAVTTGIAKDFPLASNIDYSTLKNALENPSPAVAEEIKEAVKDIPEEKKIVSSNPSPSSVPAPSQTAITNEQVNNFFTQNTSNVFNEYNNVANNTESTYNDIEGAKAAAELAKEQEEEKKEEETFPPVTSSAFEEPYDPGPYDIPERFSSFLNTVKSSGLFSFSASFFNSLPGGGSPIYEIEGGQTFSHHTIDLSQTLSGGLAVLKTVLLALFGFLSIRAVIMKR